jgi:tryptophanyl-tRNA synthetase
MCNVTIEATSVVVPVSRNATDVNPNCSVPVGEDNLQNVETCRQIAKTFNSRFGKTFPVPEPILVESPTARVRSLRDPLKKMSKSDPDKKSCIYINDSPGQYFIRLG